MSKSSYLTSHNTEGDRIYKATASILDIFGASHLLKNKPNNQLWKEHHLIDYKFKDIDCKQFVSSDRKVKAKWWLARVLALQYLYLYIADAVVARNIQKYYGGPYFALVAMSLLILYVDLKECYRIVKSDDVSDTFLNQESSKYTSLFYYDRYCLMNRVSEKFTIRDSAAFFVRNILDDWKRHFIHAIQGAILVAMQLENNARVVCALPYPLRPKDCLSNFGILMVVIRLILSFYPVVFLGISAAIYPFIRLHIIKQIGSAGTNFTTYCTFKIDKRLNELLSKHDSAVNIKTVPHFDHKSTPSNANTDSSIASGVASSATGDHEDRSSSAASSATSKPAATEVTPTIPMAPALSAPITMEGFHHGVDVAPFNTTSTTDEHSSTQPQPQPVQLEPVAGSGPFATYHPAPSVGDLINNDPEVLREADMNQPGGGSLAVPNVSTNISTSISNDALHVPGTGFTPANSPHPPQQMMTPPTVHRRRASVTDISKQSTGAS